MNIEGIFLLNISNYQKAKKLEINKSQERQIKDRNQVDEVSISSFAHQLKEVITNLDAEKVYRQDKVDSIKSKIDTGDYEIDDEKIAKEMIEDAVLKSRLFGE